ncbi:cadmium-translocating P-type ATPase [Rhodobacteraceae bacterium NNCM2]|nr:cadmium-translocating P-type ATPase [Coraliihabitans acroporae]
MPLDQSSAQVQIDLLLPGIKCAGCIATVERALNAAPGVLDSRVNLTQRRVRVTARPGATTPDELCALLGDAGYAARPFDAALHAGMETDKTGRDLLLRLGVAGFAAMNVMLLSVSVWSGADAATRDLMHWVSAMIALPAMAYSGVPFFRSAFGALSVGKLNMDVPISLAILLSAANSVLTTMESGAEAYFDAGIMLIFFLLIGRYLDHQTRRQARSAAAELTALSARTAMRRWPDGTRALCPIDELAPGMAIDVAPGERIPADGRITAGHSDIDRSLITGESLPEAAAPGEMVHAGMLNLTGPLTIEITATGRETLLTEIAEMIDAAERGRGWADRLADKAARIYAPVVHIAALLAFIGWFWATGDWRIALTIATAVLIITCPCALGLAVPTVHTVASGSLFRRGIFLKDGTELERLAQVDMVVFDKTGTLTDGAPTLSRAPDPGDPAWPIAAALAEASSHPLSQAISREAARMGVVPAPIESVVEQPGFGVTGRIEGREVRLGRPGWVGAATGDASVALDLGDGRLAGFGFNDTLRPDAAETCAQLRDLGLDLAILSGDREGAVREMAGALGIINFHAELRPGDKLKMLEGWRDQGRRVLMIGDGLNDGPALAAAHASMSPASATDVSKMAAGLVFTGSRLGPVVTALNIARAARARALESFALAGIYNVLAVPMALAGMVTPLIAALAMSGSSIVVVLNALRLRWSA